MNKSTETRTVRWVFKHGSHLLMDGAGTLAQVIMFVENKKALVNVNFANINPFATVLTVEEGKRISEEHFEVLRYEQKHMREADGVRDTPVREDIPTGS